MTLKTVTSFCMHAGAHYLSIMARGGFTLVLLAAALLMATCPALERRKHQDSCPACEGKDEAPLPGRFDFYFLVR